MNDAQMVGTPCMKTCTLDASGRICTGCLRTVDEIAAWVSLSSDQRARIVGALPERHRLLGGREAALDARTCSRCGTSFGCGASGPEGHCWCNRYPPVAPREGATCLCPACLAAAANLGT